MVSAVPDPYAIPLDQLDPGRVEFFRHGRHLACFERLRREDPVHFVQSEQFGPYWSITRFADIVYVESQREYVKIATTKQAFVSKMSTHEIEQLLPPQAFKRVHRSFIVSLDKIVNPSLENETWLT